jgi:hypothetical protein
MIPETAIFLRTSSFDSDTMPIPHQIIKRKKNKIIIIKNIFLTLKPPSANA